MIHVLTKHGGQSRGKPSLTSVMRQFKVLGDFATPSSKAAVVNPSLSYSNPRAQSGSILDLLSNDPEMRDRYKEALKQQGTSSITMDDGQIIPLYLGKDIRLCARSPLGCLRSFS